MNIVASDRITKAQQRYPAAQDHLQGWFQLLSCGEFKSEGALQKAFGPLQKFNQEYRFPVPETSLQIHVLLNFEAQVALVESIKPGSY